MGVIRFSVTGVARTERSLSRAEKALQRQLRETMRSLEPGILAVFRQHAVGGSVGRLARGLQVSRINRIDRVGFEIESTFRDPETGYDPLGVTRFGHRRKFITPQATRGAASVIATRVRRGPNKGTRPALRLTDRSGRVIYRYRVKGFEPPSDWVADARREADTIISGEAQRLGRRIVSAIS